MEITSVATPSGPAELHVDLPTDLPTDSRRAPVGLLVLGHGAGGGVTAPDLLAVRDAAVALGWAVVRVQQPWRVAGRRVAEAPSRLDAAWLAALDQLPEQLSQQVRGVPLVVGGRSAGARVACRTAAQLGAVAVLCLAFPLRPPARPDRDRLDELRLPTVPRWVVQGERDAFGVPDLEAGLEVHVVAGADHAFAVRRLDGRVRADVLAEVGAAAARLLQTLT